VKDNKIMKRKSQYRDIDISEEFLSECEEKFYSEQANIIAKNAINSVGSMFSTINSKRVNEISHIFLNSVKRKNLRSTNQGASGRCWMFAALNTFRHLIINALDLDNFEFSEVYLFFWDKLERSNSYLKWFIEHPEEKPGSRAHEYMITDYMSDGGWWNTFANLVNKYGIVPQSAMKETYQSDDSDEMNKIIKERLDSTVNYLFYNRERMTSEEIESLRKTTVSKIYEILVKFLGEPPKKFEWHFSHNDEESCGIVTKLTPKTFLEMVSPGVDMNGDFVTLAHIPMTNLRYYQNYNISTTNNVSEGETFRFCNVPVDELVKYALKSISSGFAVWFSGDVRKSFNWFHSSLDDKLDDSALVFGETEKFEKGDRIMMRNVQGNHAMLLTGYNLDEKGNPVSWQVENSWGYYDNEIPGLDGFLRMSHSWFKKYVIDIVVHKDFLSRTMRKKISQKPIDLDPWDCMAPATRVGVYNPPKGYLETLSKRAKLKV
jgi:bleomycin hydrolase